MSTLSKILIAKLEAELAQHEPEISGMLLKAVNDLAKDIVTWAESKINNQGAKNAS